MITGAFGISCFAHKQTPPGAIKSKELSQSFVAWEWIEMRAAAFARNGAGLGDVGRRVGD